MSVKSKESLKEEVPGYLSQKAHTIEIKWDGGMLHVWRRQLDDTWTLRLTDTNSELDLPLITGYDAPNVCRVITAAMER